MKLHTWGTFDKEFVDELAAWIGERKVLEVFAGNGVLAAELAGRGVDIIATSIHSPSLDGELRNYAFDVHNRDARDAVVEFGTDRDILLMSWPTTTDEAAAGAALLWGQDRLIAYIGETKNGFLCSCATDLFFDMTEEAHRFESYRSDGIDTAAIRRTVPHALELWSKARDEAILKAQNPLGFKSVRGFS